MRPLPYLGLFLGAFSVRLLYLAEWRNHPLFSVLLGDGRGYDLWAQGIAAGNWIGGEVFYQAPLYPYFLATVYSVAGHDLWTLRLVQIALGSASCVLVALAGRRFFDEATGWIAGGLLALYGPAIYFDGLIQKGVLGGLGMALLLWVAGEYAQRRSWPWLVAAGATIGAFALARENALALAPVMALWVWLLQPARPASRKASCVLLLLVGLALVLAPVGARNRAIGGRFLVTTSQAGSNFYIGNNAEADGRYHPLRPGRANVRYERRDATELAEAASGRSLRPDEVSSYWFGRSGEWIKSAPADWVLLVARKTFLVWNASEIMDTDSLEAYAENSWTLRLLGGVLHFGVVAPLAAVGLWATRREWKRLWLLYAILLSMTAAVAVFFVMARYRFPLVPILCLFAAAGGLALYRGVRAGRYRDLVPGVALLLGTALIVNWPVPAPIDARAVTYYSLGTVLLDEGRPEEARVELERALDRSPRLLAARVRLGDALVQLSRTDEAISLLTGTVAEFPEDADARIVLGTAHLHAGHAERAAEAYLAALRIDPDSAVAHNNLGILHARQGRFDEALSHWQRALRADPDDLDVRMNMAKVLLRQGRTAEALEQLAAVLDREPAHREARRWLRAAGG